MLLDLFTIKYVVDAGDAEKEIDRISNRAGKARNNTEQSGKEGVDAIGGAADAARRAIENTGTAADKANARVERLKEGVFRIKGIIGQIGDVGTMIKAGGWWGAMSSAARLFPGRETPSPTPSGVSGGGAGGVGGTGAAAAGAAASGGAGGIARATIAALGGPAVVVTAVAAALGAVGFWGVKSGHEIAKASEEKYGQLKRQAWSAGMSTQSLLTHQISGEKLGISREQMLSGLSGLNEKIKEVALHRAQPMGGIDMKTGIDTNPLSRLFRARGIKIQQGKHLESMDKIWKVIVDDLRAAAEKQGTNYALARATQQYGLDFEQASKIISATSAQVREMTQGIKQQAIQETILAQVTKNYSNSQSALKVEQEKTETLIRAKVVPGMVSWSKETTQLEKNMRPLYSIMGDVKRMAIDLATGALHWFNEGLEAAANLGEKIKNLPDTINEGAAALGKSFNNMITDLRGKIPSMLGGLDEAGVAAEKAATEAQYKAEADLRKKDREKRKAEEEADQKARTEAGRKRAFKAWEEEKGRKMTQAEKDKYAPLVDQMIAEGKLSADDNQQMLGVMQVIAEDQKKGMEANDAQFQVEKEKLSQIVVNTSVGLEQALAMWAGGIGRAGGIGTATFQGQSRADFERRSMQTRFMPDPQAMRLGAAVTEKAQRQAGVMSAPVTNNTTNTSHIDNSTQNINTMAAPAPNTDYTSAAKTMNDANAAANQAQRLNEQSRMGSQASSKKGGDLNFNGDVIVQTQSDSPQELGKSIGQGMTDIMGTMRKEISNTFDSVFKA